MLYSEYMENNSFARNLVKGKIAETIFYLLFAETGEFTIIPFGYEHTIPSLAQYHREVQVQQVLDSIRKTRDFVLISQNKREVFFVEVKYRAVRHTDDTLRVAEELAKRWHPAWLFLASPDGCYFDSCTSVISAKGDIPPLSTSWVAAEIQEKYRALLNEFMISRA
jgi:Holliday junction resolvase-like predicted endonuclease